MVLKDFMAISGQPGLFKFIAQGKNAIIVEHLETKKRTSAFSSAKISSLEEISIFTDDEDIPLGKVFDLIHEKENGGTAVDYKSDPDKLKSWFEEVLPRYNRDKVYVSDIKKVAHWYNILHSLNLLVKEEPEKPGEAEKPGEPEKPEGAEEPETKEVTGAKKSGKRKSPAKKGTKTGRETEAAKESKPSKQSSK